MNNPDKFAIATQLYLRLKRNPGRAIDVVWMMQNEAYEREILRLALAADPESAALAGRYESFMNSKPAKFARASGSTTGNYTAAAITSEGETSEPAGEQHYIGGLR